MRSVFLIGVLMVLVWASCGSDSSTGPYRTLEGTWDLVGYSDHGVVGVTTGSSTFRDDGTFVILGTVTYPGEPVDSLDVSGTYQVAAGAAKLTTVDGTSTWSLVFSGDQVLLTLIGSEPPTRMTLKRQP
jgi:hypothetical protein